MPARGNMQITLPDTIDQYEELGSHINALSSDSERVEWMRAYARGDLYFLLRFVLLTRVARLPDGNHLVRHPWWLARCRDVQFERDDVLDIWGREMGKSTIKTYADNIRLALINPDIAICIFSVKDPLAKAHLAKIRVELERNTLLKELFSDRLHHDPVRAADSWGVNQGLTIKREANRFECTFEASGYLYGVPVGKHYDLLDFDDCVDRETANSPQMMIRAKEGFSDAANLSTRSSRFSYTGTYYNDADLYRHMEREGVVTRTRLYPHCDVSKPRPDLNDIGGGEPYLLTATELRKKLRRMGRSWYMVQMMCDPRGAQRNLFHTDRVERYRKHPHKAAIGGNIYLLCDPGGGKSNQTGADPTAFMAVALQGDKNFYVIDMVKRAMTPTERINFALRLHAKWSEWSNVQEFRWEEAGTGSDVHHLERLQAERNYRFRVTRIPRGGPMSRDGNILQRDRYYYETLEPILSEARLWVPMRMLGDLDGKSDADIAGHFVDEEIGRFPVAKQDHLLSCLMLLLEEPADTDRKHIPPLIWPSPDRIRRNREKAWDEDYGDDPSSWMAA